MIYIEKTDPLFKVHRRKQRSEQLQVIRAGLGFKVNMDGFHNQQHLQM